ncbi:MAG: AAA family ATPase [Myxococcota bacterium]
MPFDEPFLREIVLIRDRIPDARRYPFDIPAVAQLDRLSLNQPLTVLVGENGSGKSTLLEAIAILVGINPEGGTKNFRFSARRTESELSEALRLVRNPRRERHALFLRAETAFNVLTAGEGYGQSWSGLHELSHGEAFLQMLQNHRPSGILLLDEPEAGLSPQRQLGTLRLLHEVLEAGSQIIMATHSPVLMAHPDAVILRLWEDGIAQTTLRGTPQFQLLHEFLERPELFVRHLLDDG